MGMFDLKKDKLTTIYGVIYMWFEMSLIVSVEVKLSMFGKTVGAIFDFF